MSKKIVLKVDIIGERCKASALSVATKLPGIKSVAVDGEKLTVVGDVDVVCLVSALRKAKFTVLVVSVGPKKVEEKKPDLKKSELPKPPLPCCCSGVCNSCCPGPMPPYPGTVVCYEEQPGYGCVIL